MASNDGLRQDNLVEEDNDILSNIVKIQAWLRGVMVRRKLWEICRVYEDIVHDLEGLDMTVVWSHDHLSCPIVRKVDRVGIKVSELPRSRDNYNQSNKGQVQSGCVHSEAKIEAGLSHVSVATSTQVPPQPYQISATVHTKHINAESEHAHHTGADQCKQVCEHENLIAISDSKLPLLEKKIVCSSTQTPDYSHTWDTLDPTGTLQSQDTDVTLQSQVTDVTLQSQDTDVTQHDKVGQHFNINTHKPGALLVSHEQDPALPQTGEKRSVHMTERSDLPESKSQLLQLKSTISMELMWIQQAVNSRKHNSRFHQNERHEELSQRTKAQRASGSATSTSTTLCRLLDHQHQHLSAVSRKFSGKVSDDCQDAFLEVKTDSGGRDVFNDKPITEFRQLMCDSYPQVAEKAIRALLPFVSLYLCESGFSALLEIKRNDVIE